MTNQKLENILNLALETPEEVRERSLNLNVGFEEESRTWELIVKYNGNLRQLEAQGIVAEELLAGYAILTVPENLVDDVAAFPQIEYVEKPKRLFFGVERGKEVSCIFPVTLREPYLDGTGVLIGIIDSGIDYTNRNFRNSDGSSRILYLWDQTIEPGRVEGGKAPEGFLTGTEFSKERIDAALLADSEEERFRLVPVRDISGHGTAVAGIAAGSSNEYQGVAQASNLIIVKLGSPRPDSFPRTTELMRAVTYVVKTAQQMNMPIAVNLSFGNTYGAHDGTSLVERFIDNAAEVGRTVICVGSGNEGAGAGHVQGNVTAGRGPSAFVELAVASYESTLNVQLWKSYADSYRITLRSPGGEEQVLPLNGEGKITLRMEQTDILIYQGEPTPYAVTQEIYFDFIPVGAYVAPGIWTFYLEGLRVVTGQYYFYLPSAVARNSNTRFFTPSPQITLTIPSTAQKVITVGAYDSTYEAYADFSGRGYVYPERTMGLVAAGIIKPDIVAPGVDIAAPDTYGGYGLFTGTSFATPFVTGAAALLMQWGIVQENDLFLYGEKVKAYLRNGARPLRGEERYPNERVGFGALCLSESIPYK
ncbi:MAG: S8 family peptidase [Lachnospiraceae bacterium]